MISKMLNYLEKHKSFAIILTVLIAIEIFFFSSFTGGGKGEETFLTKIAPILYHFIVFFLLSFFFLASIKGEHKLNKKYVIIVLTITIIYAILDEIHQIFIPLRDPSIKDILIDTAGILTSLFVYSKADKNN